MSVPLAGELAKITELRDRGLLSVSDYEYERERLLATVVPPVTDAPAPAGRQAEGDRARWSLERRLLIGALVLLVGFAGAAVGILVGSGGGSGPSATPSGAPLRAPASVAGYVRQPGTLYRAPGTLYVGYQRDDPASALALSVFVKPTAAGAAASVPLYLSLARTSYRQVTPTVTEERSGVHYACFTGTKVEGTQSVAAVVCGWPAGREVFTMVVAPSNDLTGAVSLARVVSGAVG